MGRKIFIFVLIFTGILFSQFHSGYASSQGFVMREYIFAINNLEQNVSRGGIYREYVDQIIEINKDDRVYLEKVATGVDNALSRLGTSQRDIRVRYIIEYIGQKAKYELHLLTQRREEQISKTGEGVVITILDDARCNDCMTEDILAQLNQSPFLIDAKFVLKDFSDDGVRELLQQNNLTKLPVIIFSTDQLWDGGQITPFLTTLHNGEYSLAIGEAASFDSFALRSERGFSIVDRDILSQIQAISYVKGNTNAPLTWIEYSDFGCPFCRRMHVDDMTVSTILNTYPDIINNRFQHMAFRNREVPEAIECIAEQAGEKAFYTLVDKGFEQGVSTQNDVIAVANSENMSFNITDYQACIGDGRMKDRIDTHMSIGQEVFGIRGTPGNVIVNNQSGEYEIISGAYPTHFFEEVIERLR
ncbi:thioredoxin domain-containing protein [Candidatus Gracilibacteria bacterium]|nr:thioredoxin domain-containing protein [Candidatus Gracilibacteria bacterium]